MFEFPLTVASHPLLDLGAFVTTFPLALSDQDLVSRANQLLTPLLRLPEEPTGVPMSSNDQVRGAVRDLLRHGGYKPTGRGKPASEYLIRAQAEGALSPINPAVDACNVVSLHSGLPISVVDLDRLEQPLHVGLGEAGQSYVFNQSGQSIDIEGLLCLFDAKGACANGVKDAQRTKTHEKTRSTLSLIWGTKALAGRTHKAVSWYRSLLHEMGATTFSKPEAGE